MNKLLEIPFGSRRGQDIAGAVSDHQSRPPVARSQIKLEGLTILDGVCDSPPPLLKKFHLDSIGVNTRQFLSDITPSFAALPFDHYDVTIRKTHFVMQHLPVDSPLQPTLTEVVQNPFDTMSTLKLSEAARALGPELFQQFKEIDPMRMRSIATLDVALDGNSQVTRDCLSMTKLTGTASQRYAQLEQKSVDAASWGLISS